jgi:hypothetical protein
MNVFSLEIVRLDRRFPGFDLTLNSMNRVFGAKEISKASAAASNGWTKINTTSALCQDRILVWEEPESVMCLLSMHRSMAYGDDRLGETKSPKTI